MSTLRKTCLGLASSALLLASAAPQAQLLDTLKGTMGNNSAGVSSGSSSSGSSLLGGLAGGGSSMPSLSSVGTGNLTGVLTYCMKNKYLGGTDASSVQSGLLGKLGGESKAKSDKGYQQGLSGILGGGSGNKMNLAASGGDSGLKKQVTNKVCDQVLEYGKSQI